MELPHSSLSVAYDLRPSKQIERRMIMDMLNTFQSANYNIRTYQYVGFGSIYFVDFILLHKWLYINDMTSIEGDKEVLSRVEFNKPYKFIHVEPSMSFDALPKIDKEKNTLLWLDYDQPLAKWMLNDLILSASSFKPGTFIFVTIDARPPATIRTEPEKWFEYYSEQASSFFNMNWGREHFTQQSLPVTLPNILFRAMQYGLRGRSDVVEIIPLLNFAYKDSAPMLSIGALLASKQDIENLKSIDFSHLPFLRRIIGMPPYEIYFPKLTRKERIILDNHMNFDTEWIPDEFVLPDRDLKVYKEVYKYYPAFGELLF